LPSASRLATIPDDLRVLLVSAFRRDGAGVESSPIPFAALTGCSGHVEIAFSRVFEVLKQAKSDDEMKFSRVVYWMRMEWVDRSCPPKSPCERRLLARRLRRLAVRMVRERAKAASRGALPRMPSNTLGISFNSDGSTGAEPARWC
jgi:hypothetical protein